VERDAIVTGVGWETISPRRMTMALTREVAARQRRERKTVTRILICLKECSRESVRECEKESEPKVKKQAIVKRSRKRSRRTKMVRANRTYI
jgi:hypothetical protein